MKELLPLDDFEREIREAANGFEIKPRSSVFESIRQEINAPPVSAHAGKGTIVKTIFSKSLTFMSYAAAAAVVSVGSVFVYTQKQEAPDAVLEKNRSVKTYTLKSQSTNEKEADELNSTQTETYEDALIALQENTSDEPVKVDENKDIEQASDRPVSDQAKQLNENKITSNSTVGNVDKNPVNETIEVNSTSVEEKQKPARTNVQVAKTRTPRERAQKPGRNKAQKKQAVAAVKQTVVADKQEPKPENTQATSAVGPAQATEARPGNLSPEPAAQAAKAPVIADSISGMPLAVHTEMAPDTGFTEKSGTDSLSTKKLKTNWVNVEGKRRFSVSGFYTIESTYRTLSLAAEHDPDYWFDSYSNFRNQTDLSTQTFTAGLRLDYSLFRNLSIGTALNYGERKESITINSYPEFEYDPAQQKAVITGYTKTAGTSIRTENLFRYIELPLILSYYNNIGPRFSYRISAGVGYSMLISASSYYINFDDPYAVVGVEPEYTFTNRTSSGPFRQMNSNMYLSANAGYLLNNRFEVFAGPSFKRSIRSIYKDSYPVKQKFYSKGLEIGMRYFF